MLEGVLPVVVTVEGCVGGKKECPDVFDLYNSEIVGRMELSVNADAVAEGEELFLLPSELLYGLGILSLAEKVSL